MEPDLGGDEARDPEPALVHRGFPTAYLAPRSGRTYPMNTTDLP